MYACRTAGWDKLTELIIALSRLTMYCSTRTISCSGRVRLELVIYIARCDRRWFEAKAPIIISCLLHFLDTISNASIQEGSNSNALVMIHSLGFDSRICMTSPTLSPVVDPMIQGSPEHSLLRTSPKHAARRRSRMNREPLG